VLRRKVLSMWKIYSMLALLFVWMLLCALPSSAESLTDMQVEEYFVSARTKNTPHAHVDAIGRAQRTPGLVRDRICIGDGLANLAVGKEDKSVSAETQEDFQEEKDIFEEQGEIETISDPLEPLNRVFFAFNDRLYFWVLRPVAKGYKAIVPQPARVGVKNFFYNLAFPVRFVNCMLQGKVEGAFLEMGRFILNSIVGVGGFVDVASNSENLKKGHDEDLGQTFGVYGMGPGFYINWPIFGPSSFRDSIGMVGDGFLNPIWYIDSAEYRAAVKAFEGVNRTSLSIGEYESLKKAALDPYVALRDAFYQNRRSKIKK